MVNAKRLKMFVAVMFIVAVAGCAATPARESTGEYIDDTVITTNVKAGIFNEPFLRELQISVRAYKGDVELNGFVNSRQIADKPVDISRHVAGVTSVKDSLIVK